MTYGLKYLTPTGFDNMIMTSDGKTLTSLCFENSCDMAKASFEQTGAELPVFNETIRWLDIYFGGKQPDFTPQYSLALSPFQKRVTQIMCEILWGQTTTYGEIAKRIASERGIEKMSAQAVGGAVGANKICIIIPCHRVIGMHAKLVGYGGGIQNKISLLRHENAIL